LSLLKPLRLSPLIVRGGLSWLFLWTYISPGAVSLNIPIPERMLNARAVETLIKEGCTLASPGRIDLRKVKRLFQLGFEGVGAGEELVEIAFGGLNRRGAG